MSRRRNTRNIHPKCVLKKEKKKINFGKIPEIMEIPDLVEIQKASFKQFLQKNGSRGLEAIFREVFPITDLNERGTLEFVSYSIGDLRYSPRECIEKGISYSVPIKLKTRLRNRRTGEVKEEEVFFGDLPYMTDRGTFIINGVERIVVNQLHRAPGVFYDVNIFPRGERQYSVRIIPYWGAWLEFEIESSNVMQVSIDRKRKMPATIFLKALGYDEEKLLRIFSGLREINIEKHSSDKLIGKRIGEEIYDKDGTFIAGAGDVINSDLLKLFKKCGINQIKILGDDEIDLVIPTTLKRENISTEDEALTEIYRRLRPNEPSTPEGGRALLEAMFMDPKRYRLGEIGRYKLNNRLGLKVPLNIQTLTKEDIVEVIKGLLALKKNRGTGDDIDHLGNRKVASVGELLENQFRKILLQVGRMIRERMSIIDMDSAMPHSLINIKPVVEGINNFFGMSQLSQFMDQTNPLAEITHKRRLSALGPGGLTRDTAGFEVRDVHFSHYGRICPVETPEGPNIGLIVSLSTYARVNDLGLLETPYRKVEGGRITDKIEYLTADVEDQFVIAQANARLDKTGRFVSKQVPARQKGNFIMAKAEEVDYMDISPKQLVSISASLIPFLEHDDANRALMGCNMERQSVPLIFHDPPLVGTGMEEIVARNSGRVAIAKKSGKVREVDATKIVIEYNGKGRKKETEVYWLDKYVRSNQSTCINQRPVVRKGEKIVAGQIISDGPCITEGELSLGRNVLVAYLPWEGYNFEDAILISEKLVKEDTFTSIHIEEFKVEVRDTKLGEEEITRDIPNIREESFKNLDENGIVRIGAEVKAGDILVGKVTPREEIWLSAEERLLHAIFGKKAKKVRDTSLRVPPGYSGKVIETKVFSRAEGDELPPGVSKLVKVYVAQKRKISEGDKLAGRHGNKGVVAKILPEESMPYLQDGTPVEMVLNPLGVPSRMNVGQILEAHLGLVAKVLGLRIVSPIFDGAKEDEIRDMLRRAKLPESGKMKVYDGRTGEPFENECTVGYLYMMKLYHMVDDKMHARSIGPYSLVTQQPLGGKAQFGGQRLGEMEVWALEAYGAAYTLQEMLTVKSDDTSGRTNLYEAIVKGKISPKIGIPESFNVLVRELQGLALNISFLDRRGRLLNIEELSKKDDEGNSTMLEDIVSLRIGLASPEIIKSWSYGEVKKPETINYRTFRPERDGLFCERIFGPTRDWRCFCGKYEGLRYKGITCDRCDVEVTESSVRKVRMGHIELASPVSHIWYVKEIPSPIAVLLDITNHDLESVIYFEKRIVIDPGKSSYKKKELIDEVEYLKCKEKFGESFKAKMGAEAIKELLQELDLKSMIKELQEHLKKEPAANKNKKIMRKIELVQAFLKSGNKPEWMILDVIPVIPPDLRPMVQLESGRFATSDINDLYRRVINRNNRLRKLLEIDSPEIIVQNEKRMLQEAVDALFQNGRHGVPVVMGNRVLRSLSDLLGGKQGRFRQNLLGKRVDYSGRSVVVVGPHLKFNQCGLPKMMALELFKPFILARLAKQEMLSNIKSAKRMIEEGSEEVWSILEDVIKDHPVLLNRAPTLHRLGIQAFEPVLIESKAIQLHPLACIGFNADFDGDQMAVHVPISVEAQIESRFLMLFSNNLLLPANGKPIAIPTQDIIIGCHYLTKEGKGEKGEGKYFSNMNEVITAYYMGFVGLHASIRLQMSVGKGEKKIIGTTVGRVIFNEILPEGLRYINKTMNKKSISELIARCYKLYGNTTTVELLDEIKRIGFEFATRSGLSIGILDIIVPEEKEEIIKQAMAEGEKVYGQYRRGLITDGERYNRIIDIWTRATNKLTDAMLDHMKEDQKGFNPLYLMFDSGARGSEQQIRQLGAMRGLMTKPSGEIMELPITTNFREGLSVLEYFISTHGGRKGLADTALKTADAGYLTRRLVDVAHDVVVTEEDCGTVNGINISALKEGGETIESLADRIIGRVTLGDVLDPLTGEIIVKDNQEITEDDAYRIEKAGIEKVRIRTVLTCESERGVCRKCYGRDLATGKMVNLGEAVGVIAAQSIGEPGTQLTLRTFHIGGTAYTPVEEKDIRLKFPVEVIEIPKNLIRREKDGALIANRHGEMIVRRILARYKIPPRGKITVFDGLWVTAGERLAQENEKVISTEVTGIVKIDQKNHTVLITGEEYPLSIQAGAEIKVEAGEIVPANKPLVEFDPYNEPILTEISGKVKFQDIVRGETIREEPDKTTGLLERVIIEHKEGKYHPRIIVENKEKSVTYSIPVGAHLVVVDGRKVSAGDVLVKIPRQVVKSKDITGGLPRVEELFEARHVQDKAIISEVDGTVEFGSLVRGARKIIVKGERGTKEYVIPEGKHLRVREGDRVTVGEPLTSGSIDPHDILEVKGERALQEYLVNEIQAVYRLQGVDINDKHIEIIVRQMLRRVEITDPGDTKFLSGEHVEKFRFKNENEKVISKGGKPAQGKPILQGITKSALNSDSFIAAASFQETTHVLAEAAINGRYDELLGIKENVIIGRLIPAGTGLPIYRNIQIDLSQPFKASEQIQKVEGE